MNRISHGFLGKFKTYEIPVPQVKKLTPEEREKALREKIKPWVYDPEKLVRIGGYVPTTTPPPPVETFYLETAEGDALQTAQGDNILWYIEPAPPPAFDTDAAAYLSAVVSAGGSVDATMSAATNTLYTSLKSNGLYTKLDVFYPLLGGTSSSHSIMGIRASGTTYDITWGGDMTHSISGITGTRTSNSWGNLGYNGNNTILGNRTWSLYSFIENTLSGYDFSIEENGLILGYGNTNFYGLMDGTNYDAMPVGTTRGMYVSTEPSLNTQRNFHNGVNTGNFTRTSQKYNNNFAIGAKGRLSGTPIEPTARGYNWIGIGEGLSDTEAQTLSTIINTFQTSLGRNTY